MQHKGRGRRRQRLLPRWRQLGEVYDFWSWRRRKAVLLLLFTGQSLKLWREKKTESNVLIFNTA